MASLILANTAAQTCLAICESYNRITGFGYAGPTGTCSDPNSGFCIQSPNKNVALYVANTYTQFRNSNTLGFNYINNPTSLCLYPNQSFCITDNTNAGTYFRVGPDNCLLFGTGSNTCTFSINSNGNVGIGTNSAYYKLEVRDCNPNSSVMSLWNDYSATAQYYYVNSIFQMGVKSGTKNAFVNQVVAWASGYPYYHISNSNVCTFYSNFNDYFFRDYNDRILLYLSSNKTSDFGGYIELRAQQYNVYSGDWAGIGSRNMKPYGNHFIDFMNASGGRHSSMHSTQYQDGGSQLRFHTTAPGAYSETERRNLVLMLGADRKANFYGNICALTGCFNLISGSEACITGNIKANWISGNRIINNGNRTILGGDDVVSHWFASYPCGSDLSLGYGFTRSLSSDSKTGFVTQHRWNSSGVELMCLTPSVLQVCGVVCSNSGLKITGSSANNIYGKSLCISLTDSNNNLCISGNQYSIGNITSTQCISGCTGYFSCLYSNSIPVLTTGQTGNFITTSQTGQFVSTGNTGNFILSSQTGAFITTSQTGAFATAQNITGVVLTGQTGNFITTSQTGQFVSNSSTGNFITSTSNCFNSLFGVIDTSSQYSQAFGGLYPTIICSTNSFLVGGTYNCIKGTVGNFAAAYSSILNGCCNTVYSLGSPVYRYNQIINGYSNIISGNGINNNTILNSSSSKIVCSVESSLIGGNLNCIINQSNASHIIGGLNNIINNSINNVYIGMTNYSCNLSNTVHVPSLISTGSIKLNGSIYNSVCKYNLNNNVVYNSLSPGLPAYVIFTGAALNATGCIAYFTGINSCAEGLTSCILNRSCSAVQVFTGVGASCIVIPASTGKCGFIFNGTNWELI